MTTKITEQDLALAKLYNDTAKYPTLQDVADAAGLARKTVKNKIGIIRQQLRDAPSPLALKLISRTINHESPMSEDHAKFKPDWTADDCIEHLARMAAENPEIVISRNHFRNTAECSESTWNRYFGTFEEFKRQAGLKLTRQVHKVEREIAKHASVDHYRNLNIERLDYDGKYARGNRNRFKTYIVCSDLHDQEVDEFFLRVLIDTVKRVQPDGLILGGDIFDLPEFGKYGVDPREWNVVGRIKFVHDRILRPLREACASMEITFIEGNHEARLLRHLADATPALRAVLSDLHGMTISSLLGLDEFEINYVAKADLKAWREIDFTKELANNYKVFDGAFMFHHFPYARNMAMPGANGHHHAHMVWSQFNPTFGAYEWHQLGSGHRRAASYTEGEKWHNGFLITHIDTQTKSVVSDYAQIRDHACVGGKFYHRNPDEAGHGVIPSLRAA
jgi:hypothetical protein